MPSSPLPLCAVSRPPLCPDPLTEKSLRSIFEIEPGPENCYGLKSSNRRKPTVSRKNRLQEVNSFGRPTMKPKFFPMQKFKFLSTFDSSRQTPLDEHQTYPAWTNIDCTSFGLAFLDSPVSDLPEVSHRHRPRAQPATVSRHVDQ